MHLLQKDFTGSGLQHTLKKKIGKIEIPVLPLDEQEHIVAKIEELFSNLDSSVVELQSAKEKLKVYRQAVLKEAFEGNYPQERLDKISIVITGYAFKSKLYTPNGKFVVVKIGNVKERKFDFSRDLTKTNETDENILNKYLLKSGDCLITLTGSRGKRDYGFVTMVENQSNLLLNQRVAAIRFNKNVAFPEFYQYYLSSPIYRESFFAMRQEMWDKGMLELRH